ncbi:hypothetical protein AVEN_42068-1, partial [Araneus ventricosus]
MPGFPVTGNGGYKESQSRSITLLDLATEMGIESQSLHSNSARLHKNGSNTTETKHK